MGRTCLEWANKPSIVLLLDNARAGGTMGDGMVKVDMGILMHPGTQMHYLRVIRPDVKKGWRHESTHTWVSRYGGSIINDVSQVGIVVQLCIVLEWPNYLPILLASM